MSDARLRQLERDAATGDLTARARLLAERVRIGDLAPDRLQLAAYLGDEAAEEALGKRPFTPPTITVGRWVRGLARPTVGVGWPDWAVQAYSLAAGAAARAVLPCFADRDPVAATRAVEALEAWIACPCDEHGRASAAAAAHVPQSPPGHAGLFASRGVRFAGLAILRAAAIPLGRAGLLRGATPPETIAADTAADAARATSAEVVRAAIRDALVPWALQTPGSGPRAPLERT